MKRQHIFIICVLVRLFLALLAKHASPLVLKIMAIFFIGAALGMLNQYYNHPTKKGAFGGEPWWNKLRPIHSSLYLLFAILVFTKYHSVAWVVLLVDVIFGSSAFINHYYL